MKQSRELTLFYQAYKAWLDSGAPKHRCFNRLSGLCYCLYEWCSANERRVVSFVLMAEFKQQLVDAFPDAAYPFGGEDVYDDETAHRQTHLNPARIAWVEAHVEG